MPTSRGVPPPFRAEHIGSLLRPPELREAFRAHHAGQLSAESFQRVQDECVRQAVRLQEELGLESITDGEFRRPSYFAHFLEAVDGFTDKEALFTFQNDQGEKLHYNAPHVKGKLQRKRGISTDAFRFLQTVTKRTPKLTMPSPSTMHFFRGSQGVETGAYPDEEEFFEDLVRIYREELAELYALGAHYIQIDEVPLVMLCDPQVREATLRRGENPDRLTTRYSNMLNAALEGRPPHVTVGVHLCRGNYRGRWLAQGGYEAIADRLFNQIQADAYFLEYDTPRAGGFEPLGLLPGGKTVVLGLVSSKKPELESLDELRRRVDEAAKYAPLERLAISPQCGFATSVAGNPVTPDVQKQKLARVVEAANQIWGE